MISKRRARNWDDLMARVTANIPIVDEIDWASVLREDPKILGNLINDIIKISVSNPGRPGKRSATDEKAIADDLRKLVGDDYADSSFPAAFMRAKQKRSYRQIANSSGIDKMVVHRLSQGQGPPPSMEQMELLAESVKKHPSYFVEYRAGIVCSVLYRILSDNAESATVYYRKIQEISNV